MSADSRTIDSVIAAFRQAAEANVQTAGRRGSLVAVGGDARDLVVGADLHGHRLNFQRILRHADLQAHPERHLAMQEVCHGGPSYPGARACMSPSDAGGRRPPQGPIRPTASTSCSATMSWPS